MRRWLLTSVVVMGLGLSAPGLASAAQSFAIGNGSGGNTFPAGGNVAYTTTMSFDSAAGAPERGLITTSPGVLAALSANPSCVQSVQHTEACHIGDGTASILGGAPASLTAYLVPPTDPAHDVAGVDLVSSVGSPTHAEIQLVQNSAGNVSAVLNVDFSTLGPTGSLITGSTLTVNPTLNGKPFTRMPTNCNPGPSSLTVEYANGKSETTAASPDFSITGCASLPYAPHMTATAVKDARDAGVTLTTVVTQAPNEAATATQVLKTPGALAPNVPGVSLQNTTTAVGMATAVSPLLPTPLVGQVYLVGTPLKPELTIKFPPPNALSLTGTVDLTSSTVTFTGIPDVPQTQLTVTLFGGAKALEAAPCIPSSGTISGSFTAQSGKTATSSQLLTVRGCPRPKPSVSRASLSGLAGGHPVLDFTVRKALGGPKLKSVTVILPRGLSFNPHKRRHGLSAGRGKVLALTARKLTVTWTGGSGTVQLKLASPLLVARKHRLGRLKLRLSVTDASGARSRLTTHT